MEQSTAEVLCDLARQVTGSKPVMRKVDAFDLDETAKVIRRVIKEREWQAEQLIFNVTGGTKLMALAAYTVAQEKAGSMVIYLQTAGGKTLCYEYVSRDGHIVCREEQPVQIGPVLRLNDYLLAQGLQGWRSIPSSSNRLGILFEQEVAAALRSALRSNDDELLTNVWSPGMMVELDILIRCGNQVGVMEVKWVGPEAGAYDEDRPTPMDGLKQLATFAAPTHLGTYAIRFLVIDRQPTAAESDFARAIRVNIIALESFRQNHRLSEMDKAVLVDAVCSRLRGN